MITLLVWWFELRIWVSRHLFTEREKALMQQYFARVDGVPEGERRDLPRRGNEVISGESEVV